MLEFPPFQGPSQSRTVARFISGTVGKKLGLAVESVRREDGERVYRVVAAGKEA
jgi:hypothetical protein